jgi:hypothetical protein
MATPSKLRNVGRHSGTCQAMLIAHMEPPDFRIDAIPDASRGRAQFAAAVNKQKPCILYFHSSTCILCSSLHSDLARVSTLWAKQAVLPCALSFEGVRCRSRTARSRGLNSLTCVWMAQLTGRLR